MTDMERKLRRELDAERARSTRLDIELRHARADLRHLARKASGAAVSVQPVAARDGDGLETCSSCGGDLDSQVHSFCPGCGGYVRWDDPLYEEEDGSLYDSRRDMLAEEAWARERRTP